MGDFPAVAVASRYEATDGKDGIQDTTVDSDSKHVSVTPNASAHTKGSYADLINGTRFDANRLLLWIAENNAGARTANDYLIDLALSVGGSDRIVIPDMAVSPSSGLPVSGTIDIPLLVPAGSVIRARAQCGAASGTALNIGVMVCGHSWLTPQGGVATFDTLGANTGTTRATAVDPGGTVNTFGTAVVFSTSTAFDYKGFFLTYANAANTTISPMNQNLLQVMVGSAGNEKVIVPMIPVTQDSGSDAPRPNCSPFFPVDIPAGSRVTIKSQCNQNTATDRVVSVCMHMAR